MISGTRKEPAPSQSLVVNMDEGVITLGSIGKLSIIKRTDPLKVFLKMAKPSGRET